MKEKTEEKKSIGFWIWCFFVYCFLGWIYEVVWEFKVGNGFVNRGFLYGPYLPIYGFGILIMLFILQKPLKANLIIFNRINLKPLIVFVSVFVIGSIVEYITSFVMELLFNKRWWDYSYDKFNINGRVSARNSLLLAIGGTLLICIIQPLLDKTIGRIAKKKVNVSGAIIASIMAIDLIITVIGYIK